MTKFIIPFTVALVLGGYQLTAIISVLVGFDDSSALTYVYRLLVLLLSLLTLLLSVIKCKEDSWKNNLSWNYVITVSLFGLFMSMYGIRLVWDLQVVQVETIIEPIKYFSMFFLAIFIPCIAILTSRNVDFALCYKFTFIILFLAVVLNLSFGALDFGLKQIVGNSRLNNDKLNPIAFGHMCASLSILCLYSVLFLNPRKKRFTLLLAGVSIFGVLLSNSKGPLLALFIVLYLMLLIRFPLKSVKSIIITISMPFILLFLIVLLKDHLGIDIAGRFMEALSGSDESTSSRLHNYSLAFMQFINNPIIGDAIVVIEAKGYPHNIIIEIFMALGVIGGGIFLLLFIHSILTSISIIRINTINTKPVGWIGFLFLQHALAAQTSGAVWSVNVFWYLLCLVLLTAQMIRSNRT